MQKVASNGVGSDADTRPVVWFILAIFLALLPLAALS